MGLDDFIGDTVGLILAGGEGTRIAPLSNTRAKIAIPFGARWRIADVVLSNMVNSKIDKIEVCLQKNTRSFLRHMREWYAYAGVKNINVHTIQNEPSMGTAHAVYQIWDHVFTSKRNKVVDIFAGDHIFLMDIRRLNKYHFDKGADLTICCLPVLREAAANRYGVMSVDSDGRIVKFTEKPADPDPLPDREEYSLISIGNYAFNPFSLEAQLMRDAKKELCLDQKRVLSDPGQLSSRDFGFDIIPQMIRDGMVVYAYDFAKNVVPGIVPGLSGYWRDIGEIHSYYEANMDLLEDKFGVRNSPLAVDNDEWPIRTSPGRTTPPYVSRGSLVEAVLLAEGVIIDHARVAHSLVSYATYVGKSAIIEDSIVLGYSKIGEGVVIKRAIVDRNVSVPAGETVGVDFEPDRKRGFRMNENDIAVVPKMFSGW